MKFTFKYLDTLKNGVVACCYGSMNTPKNTFKKQHPPMKKLFFTWKEVGSQLAFKKL